MGGEQDAAAPIVHVSTASYSEREARAAVMELAIFSCVNLIAETAARAEVRTFHKNKELHGLEHYAWNVQPNINQNAVQLKRELFARALYFGEALLVEVNGQMLVAQSFQRAEHATAPDEFFGIVLRGDTAIKRRLTSDEVIYITTQNSEARAMLGELGALYGDMLRTSASNYKRAGGMRGTLEIGTQASGDPDFEKDLETLMNERFKAYFEAKNAVLPLTEGYKYTPQTGATIQSASEMSAIEKLTVQQFARACNAYKIPQEIFTGQAGETCARRRLNYIAGWNDRRENTGPYKRDKGTVGRYICKSIRDYYNANHCGSGCGDLPVEHKREFQKLYSDVLAEYTGRRAGVF